MRRSDQSDAVWKVAAPLRDHHIRGLTMAGFTDRGSSPVQHRLIPHPEVSIVLDVGPSPPIVDDGAGRAHRGAMVAGLGFGGAATVSGCHIACVQVRLAPLTARAALGIPLSELAGVTELERLWPRSASRIRERLTETDDWQQRFDLTVALLRSKIIDASQPEAELRQAWNRIAASRGRLRIERLAQELGWSRKRLWSRFSDQYGLSPKRAAKLVRFDHAVHLLVAGQSAATVAARSGYVDQPHLHRDIVEFAKVTPSAIRDEPFLAVDAVAWPLASITVEAH